MNTKITNRNNRNKELILKLEFIKNIPHGRYNNVLLKPIHELIIEFLILNEGIVFPAVVYENGSVVESNYINGMLFLEEHLISDFIKYRLNSEKFIDWITKIHLRNKFIKAIRLLENPK